MEIRNSRETGLSRYRFIIRGEKGISFDYVVVTHHGAFAQAEVRALFGNRVIGLMEVRPVR